MTSIAVRNVFSDILILLTPKRGVGGGKHLLKNNSSFSWYGIWFKERDKVKLLLEISSLMSKSNKII